MSAAWLNSTTENTHYRKLIDLNPRTIAGRISLTGVLNEQKKYDEAEKLLDEAARIDPDSINISTLRAAILLDREKTDKAGAPLTEAFKRDPGSSSALYMRVYLQLAQNNNLGALADVNKLGEYYPEDPSVILLRAHIYNMENNPKSALAEIDKAEKIDKNINGLHAERAMSYTLQGEMKKAIASGKKAIEMAPWDAISQMMTGDAYFQQGEYKDAIPYMQKAVELDPQLRYAYFALGISQWFTGEIEAAVPNLEKMVTMKGKLDMELIDQAEQAWYFLKDVPKLENGLRTVKDEENHYTIAYNNDWIPQPPEAEQQAAGMQFRLTPRDYKGDAVIQVQAITMPDDVPAGMVTASSFADSVRSVITQMSDTVTFEERSFMECNGNSGVVDTFQISYQSQTTGSNVPARMRVYYFVFGKSLISVHYVAGLADFDKLLPKTEEVVKTLNAVK